MGRLAWPATGYMSARGGSDDEARHRCSGADAESACDSAERNRGGALLRRDQGQTQKLVRASRGCETGAADGRADEALPGIVDECETCVAECAHEIPGLLYDLPLLISRYIGARSRRERPSRRPVQIRPPNIGTRLAAASCGSCVTRRARRIVCIRAASRCRSSMRAVASARLRWCMVLRSERQSACQGF